MKPPTKIVNTFAVSFLGGINQGVSINDPKADKLGLPESRLSLPKFNLADAFDGKEVNLFQVLSWEYGLVETLYGRDQDIEDIIAWAEKPTRAATVRLVSGEGGAGKTRLAAAVAERLRQNGWNAGFLPRYIDSALINVGEKGLLIILDYPEEQPERVRLLLDRLADLVDAPYPIRVLLLSRRGFDSWESDFDKLKGRAGQHAISTPGPLPPDIALRVIGEASKCFAKARNSADPPLESAVNWLNQSDTHRLPLFAMAAAVHAVIEPKSAFGLAGGELLHALARRERQRVKSISEAIGLGNHGLGNLLALAILSDGLDQAKITTLFEAGIADGTILPMVSALTKTPWWSKGRLARIQPDRPAAAFICDALFGPDFPNGQVALPDWLFIALNDANGLAERLSRLLNDIAGLGSNGQDRLIANLIEMLSRDNRRAAVFAPLTGTDVSHWVAPFTAAVGLALASSDDDPVKVALHLNNASVDLSATGQREAALSAAQKATGLYRDLATDFPHLFTPNLATSLSNLANRLSDVGQREAALDAAREAVDLSRDLASVGHDTFAPSFAACLNNLAVRLSELGQHEAALDAARETTDLYRELASARPDQFTQDLAMSLNTLANRRSNLGQRQMALEAAKEATDLYRDLANARPDTFMPDFAGSLNNLAGKLSDLGQHNAALDSAREAVDLLRSLARALPSAFTPNLAASLNNIANRLSNTGEHEAALKAAKEAADLYRDLANVRPDTFIPNLATSLTNLASMLSNLGQRDAALETVREAVDLRRDLAKARPGPFTPDLAASLNNMSGMLSDFGQLEAALAAAREAVALRRDLAKARPDAVMPDLAGSLANLAEALAELNQPAEAFEFAKEALELLAPYFETSPAAFTSLMRGVVRIYQERCREINIDSDLEILSPILALLQPNRPIEKSIPPTSA